MCQCQHQHQVVITYNYQVLQCWFLHHTLEKCVLQILACTFIHFISIACHGLEQLFTFDLKAYGFDSVTDDYLNKNSLV